MLLIAIGRLMHFFLLFATIKVSTTLLSPSEMAKVFLVTSLVAFYSASLLSPVGMFINRRIHAWNEQGHVQHYYDCFWLYLISVCVFSAVSISILVDLGWIGSHTAMAWMVFLVVGTLLFSTVNQVVIPGLNMFGYRGWYVALTLATAVTCLAASIVLVFSFSPKAESWICGQMFGQLLLAAIGWKVFYRKLSPRKVLEEKAKEHIKTLLRFAWPISIGVGLGWVQNQSYRFMMESGLGLSALGLFAAGFGISAGIIAAFDSVFATYLQPIFYKRVSGDDIVEQGHAWSEYAGAYFPSLILVSLLIVAAAPELTRVMLGPKFHSSYQFVVWGVIAETARIGFSVYGLIAYARMNTKLLLIPGLVGASVAVFFVWLLMPILGAAGVGVALAISSLASLIIIYISTRNEFVVSLPKKRLVASLGMGGVLWLLAQGFQRVFGEGVDLHTAMIRLSVLGIVFLLFQYVLLRPLLRGHYRYE